jgi:hypothetical protein
LVTAHAEQALQSGRRDTALAGADMEDGEEPFPERLLGLLEHGSGDQRLLVAAGVVFKGLARRQVMRPIRDAGSAAEPVKPFPPGQVIPALAFVAEAIEKVRHGARKIGFDHARSSIHGDKCSCFVP